MCHRLQIPVAFCLLAKTNQIKSFLSSPGLAHRQGPYRGAPLSPPRSPTCLSWSSWPLSLCRTIPRLQECGKQSWAVLRAAESDRVCADVPAICSVRVQTRFNRSDGILGDTADRVHVGGIVKCLEAFFAWNVVPWPGQRCARASGAVEVGWSR